MAKYLIPDKVENYFGLIVNKYLLTEHNVNKISMPSKRTKKLRGITIHNTGWINVNSATTPAEQYTRATVNGNMNSVRVHYYVDDKCAWQNLDDSWQGWHAADGNGDGNTTTISIECIMKSQYDIVSKQSMDNCARLTAYLCYKYGLTVDDIYTHTYWLHIRDKDAVSKCGDKNKICTAKHIYKVCPIYIIPQFDEFLELVVKYYSGAKSKKNTVAKPTVSTSDSETSLPYLVKVVDKDPNGLNVRKGCGVNYPIVTTIKYGGVYTIVEERRVGNSIWGLLKAYQKNKNAWINLSEKYVKKL